MLAWCQKHVQLQRSAAARHSLYIKYLTENIYNDYNIMLFYSGIFTGCSGSMRTFSKHYSKCKTVSEKFIKEEIADISQDNPQKNFWNILTSKNIFITLPYSGDILGVFLKHFWIFWKHYFVITGIYRKINVCYYQLTHF